MMKLFQTILFASTFLYSFLTLGQLSIKDPLFQTLKAKDSLLFDRAFNHCETQFLESLVSENFEFYHDQSGITPSKADFLKVMREGICRPNNPNPSRRELLPESLVVFPLYNNGVLYGAIQKGEHRFFQMRSDGKETYGSTANFTHLWIKENDGWKLARVLSYNHHSD